LIRDVDVVGVLAATGQEAVVFFATKSDAPMGLLLKKYQT
jgi:hypothetical protein